MSLVYQYPNTTLQHGDEFGNISHQGILASNISGSTLLTSTFPTTSTGDSLGHYHYTESGTNALKFLNVAGSGSGGHKFYTSNSTSAPVNTATIGLDGLTIDTSVSGTPPVYSPNVYSLSDNLRSIFFPPGTNLTLPPYNMTQTFNPVYMTQTTALYTTGDLAYAVLGSNDSVQIFNNNNVTNPIPPNVVPSDFGNSSNVGITTGIPIFSLTLPTPTTTQTVNLYENLTITNDTDTSALTATSLTFNNINIKMNQFTSTLIYSSLLIYADAQPPATSLLIRNTYGYSGWYFKNVILGQKINWYFPAKTPTTTPVSALKGISISFFNGANTSNDNTLFITVLTVPTGSGDFAPGFFHSSNTYVFNQTINPIANTNYQGVCIIDKSLIPFNYETQIQYEPSTVNNPRGTYLPTDNILAVVIGTNSTSPVNSVELVVNKLNLHYDDFTQSYLLVSP
jgi:hypothetical protein